VGDANRAEEGSRGGDRGADVERGGIRGSRRAAELLVDVHFPFAFSASASLR